MITPFTPDRCAACGLLVRLHYTVDNRKISCKETARRHPRASKKKQLMMALWTQALKGE